MIADFLSLLGIVFTKWLSPLLDVIREDNIGAGLAFAVLLAGCAVWLYLVGLYFLHDRPLIRKATEILAQGGSEQAFAENYAVIAQEMEAIPAIGEQWGEFCETLLEPEPGPDGRIKPASNTVRPHVFFNTDDLNLGPKILTVWPNIFVGIGLTITFLGLISALTEASASMRDVAGSPEAVQEVVENLLNVASAKFYASLVALAVSVVLTLSLRIVIARLTAALRKLNAQIEAGVRYLSQEALANSANMLLAEQLEQLKTFNTDLAIKVGEKVTEAIRPAIDEIVRDNEQARQGQAQEFSDLGNRVSEAMSGATQDAMERVASSLEAVSEKLESLGDVLTNSLKGFDDQLKISMEKLSTALASTMQKVSEDLGTSVGSLGPQIQESLKSITDIMDGLKGKIEEYASKGAEETGRSIETATDAAGRVISKAGDEFAGAFNTATAGLINNLENLASNLSTLDKNLDALPSKLDNVGLSLTTAADSISTASTQFTTSAGGMKSVIEPLAEFASQNREALELLNSGLRTSSAAVEASAKDIETSVTTLSESVKTRLDQLSEGDAALEKYVQGINDSVGQVLENISSFVSKVDQGVSGSIGQLQGAIDDLAVVAEQLAQVSSQDRPNQ